MQNSNSSIHASLIKMLIIPLGLFLFLVFVYLYYLIGTKVNTFFDNKLYATAHSIEESIGVINQKITIDLPNFSLDFLSANDEGVTYYSVIDENDNFLVGHTHLFEKYRLKNSNKRFYNLTYDNQELRAFTYKTTINSAGKDYSAYITVAEGIQERSASVNNLLSLLVVVMCIVVLFTISISLLAVKKGLFPLRQLQRIIKKRDSRDLKAIKFSAPDELKEIVSSVNLLLKRSRDTVDYVEKFNSDVSHQLRTPLAELKMKLSMIYNSEDKIFIELNQLINDMSHITEQLLLYTKTNPNTINMNHFQSIELNKFCKEYSLKTAPRVYMEGFEYAFEDIEEKVFIYGDSILLESMLDNIVNNSLLYARDKNNNPIGILTLSLERHNNTIWLNIKDDGCGLEKKHLRKIFNRFYRIDTNKKGSGLGLSIVKQIASLHQAKVLASNDSGLKISIIFNHSKDNYIAQKA